MRTLIAAAEPPDPDRQPRTTWPVPHWADLVTTVNTTTAPGSYWLRINTNPPTERHTRAH